MIILKRVFIAFCIFGAVLVICYLFHIKIYAIDSGSMASALNVGSLVVVVPKDFYAVGDIVTYSKQSKLTYRTTHRVIKKYFDKDIGQIAYLTKGDANTDEDIGIVKHEQIFGKVILQIPFLGYVSIVFRRILRILSSKWQ